MSNALFPKGCLTYSHDLGPRKGYGVVVSEKGWEHNSYAVSREGKSLGDDQVCANWVNRCFQFICDIKPLQKTNP